MAESKALKWDEIGEKLYENGVDQGVLYPQEAGLYPKGVAWNGLVGVDENPSGAEATPLWADNRKYLNLYSAEDFGATVQAYMYPNEFKECNGEKQIAKGVYVGQQPRKSFGLCYRTTLGNDTENEAYGYILHFVYGCKASPSQKSFQTRNDNPDAITFSWEVTTTPVNVKGMKPTAVVTIVSTEVDPEKLAQLEAIIYGGEADPRLPLPDEIAEIVGNLG